MLLAFGLSFAVMHLAEQSFSDFFPSDPDLHDEPYQDILPISLGGTVLAWFVATWSLRRLKAAASDAARVGPSAPEARISTDRLPREVKPLVDAANGALDRLADAYEIERRFVADAAHALRTPIAVLNLRLQRAKLGGTLDWSAVERDLGQLSQLANQLLSLTRKEHARRVTAISDCPIINLSRIAREAAAAVFPIAEDADRPIEMVVPDAMPVRGRPDDLRDMIRNLLDNALIHGAGTIRVFGEVVRERSQAAITVSDEGNGVPNELQGVIFNRFQKGLIDSPGHGLGLAIVKEVVRAHNGSVGFLPGQGCRIQILLPAAEKLSDPLGRWRPADALDVADRQSRRG
jgi:two-component system sensor histidine kinase QseC